MKNSTNGEDCRHPISGNAGSLTGHLHGLGNMMAYCIVVRRGHRVKDAAGGDEGAGAEAFGRGTDTPQQPDPREKLMGNTVGTTSTPEGHANQKKRKARLAIREEALLV